MVRIFYIILGWALSCGLAFADGPVGFYVDVSSAEALAGTVLGALAVLWVIRKLIKVTNKS